MAEEQQRCGESHRLCANNCGFFGSPATLNLCSKCYRHLRLKQDSVNIAVKNSLTVDDGDVSSIVSPPSSASSSPANRCVECRKKVGLTGGFKCRCGSTYCGSHRYPEAHACEFDYRASGREAIARANPLVKADKLSQKI